MTDRDPLVHFIGSVPLANTEAVFRRLGAELGPHAKRIVDGETGRRANWIGFIQELLADHPAFEEDTARAPMQFRQWDGKLLREWLFLKIKDGVDSDSIQFDTGYVDDAIAAFEVFDRLQTEGVIPNGVKYQACCGTPLGVAYIYVSPESQSDFCRVYTRHLLEEVDKIAAALPHDRICYQWDVAPEVLLWDGYMPERAPNYKEDIWTSLMEVGDGVPTSIDIGYHLCYGSPADEHMVQPNDLQVCVDVLNGVFERVRRSVQFVHVSVPVDRNDDDYFRPLDNLKLPPETEFYLGCIHPGEEVGNLQKWQRASAHTRVTGFGSECGWGRGNPGKLEPILDAHKRLLEMAADAD